MINTNQLKALISRTLRKFDLHSGSAVNLLLGTCLQESRGGTYLRQMSNDFDIGVHAIGIMQMEKNTFDWMLEKYDYKISMLLNSSMNCEGVEFEQLEYNLELSILFARLRYLAVPEALPESEDLRGLANYWKKYYNTIHGAGTVEEFINIYKKYVLR